MNKLVSIIIVNYNGKHLLEECLSSVFAIKYPKDKYEVIVVDNDSQDDSVNYIKKNFPKVKVVESEKNIGFAGGNNLGIKYASGEYYVFLNSDTKVDRDWLTYLVQNAQQKNIGVVSSKLIYYTPFLELQINSSTHLKSDLEKNDKFVTLGLVVENIYYDHKGAIDNCWYKSGFYENDGTNIKTKWTNGEGVIFLPIENEQEKFRVIIHGVTSDFKTSSTYEIKLGNKVIKSGTIDSNDVKSIEINVHKKNYENDFVWLVQNAGNILFKNGQGRDIGAVIKNDNEGVNEFYDFDTKYYQNQRHLVGLCGASFLIKKEIVDRIGLFNEDFFMYYEDVDLGLRVWKSGWEILFEPNSIVYHKHKATTNKEKSIFFKQLVIRNHLIFLISHFPIKVFLRKIIPFVIKSLILYIIIKLFELMKYYGGKYKLIYNEMVIRINTLKDIKNIFFKTIKKRKELESKQKRNFNQLVKYLY